MTTTSNQARVGRSGAVTFHRPVAFWLSVVAVTAGVLLHIPMYLMGRHNGYRLALPFTVRVQQQLFGHGRQRHIRRMPAAQPLHQIDGGVHSPPDRKSVV